MNLKNKYLKLLKWANKKQTNINIYKAAFLKNKEKTPADIITLHLSTKNLDDMTYNSWDTEHDIGNFRSFFALLPP